MLETSRCTGCTPACAHPGLVKGELPVWVDKCLLETPNISKVSRTCFEQLPAVQRLCDSPQLSGAGTGIAGQNQSYSTDKNGAPQNEGRRCSVLV